MSENISLESRIFRDYQKASKEGRKVEVSILRIIRAEIKNSEIRKKEKLTDEEIQKILNSLLKTHNLTLKYIFLKASGQIWLKKPKKS